MNLGRSIFGEYERDGRKDNTFGLLLLDLVKRIIMRHGVKMERGVGDGGCQSRACGGGFTQSPHAKAMILDGRAIYGKTP